VCDDQSCYTNLNVFLQCHTNQIYIASQKIANNLTIVLMFKLYTVLILPIEFITSKSFKYSLSGCELYKPTKICFSMKSTQNHCSFLNSVKILNAFFQKIKLSLSLTTCHFHFVSPNLLKRISSSEPRWEKKVTNKPLTN